MIISIDSNFNSVCIENMTEKEFDKAMAMVNELMTFEDEGVEF